MKSESRDKDHDGTEKLKKTFEDFHSETEMQNVQKTAKEVADVATEIIRKYPIQSVLGAVAIGFLIGSLLKKK